MSRRATRKSTAALLALVATLGLVLAPVIHAEVHRCEEAQAREQVLAVVFRLAFNHHRTAAETRALNAALEEAFGTPESRPGLTAEGHQHGPHGHSHGPGPHGAGSLEHLGAAIHSSPAAPAVKAPAARIAHRGRAPAPLFLTPHYSTPEHAQGPPAV